MNAEVTGSNPVEARKTFFRATSQLLKLRFNCDGHMFISFVFPQLTSFHSAHHFIVKFVKRETRENLYRARKDLKSILS